MNEVKNQVKKQNVKKNKTMVNKGITLIALVITIIVLLILAGVTIATLTGQNGILTNATKSKEENEKGNELDLVKLASSASLTDSQGQPISLADLQNNLNKQNSNATARQDGSGFIVKFNDSEREYKVDQYGKVEEGTGGTPSTGGITVGETATENTTIDGNAGNYKNPIIPKGFKAIDTDTAKWGTEDGYQNGLVIEDGIAGSETIGSQFVWVPVENFSNFKAIEGYYNGSLDSMLPNCKEAGKEGSAITTPESIAMYKSVENNGGFYIARFEAGITGTTDNDSLVTKTVADGSVKPLSKAGLGVWNTITWGGTSAKEATDGLQGNDQADGAVKVARSMYNDKNKYGATSTLCYGVQWDAMMNFIDSNYLTGTCADDSFVKNSTDKGNYTGSIKTTGYYAEKNIYDLAGNVYEWTTEAFDTSNRVLRGGNYDVTGSYYPASLRDHRYPDLTFSLFGFRPTLYV